MKADAALPEAIAAAIEALEEQFNRSHGDDWSAADEDRHTRDRAVLEQRIAALRAASGSPTDAALRELVQAVVDLHRPHKRTELPPDECDPTSILFELQAALDSRAASGSPEPVLDPDVRAALSELVTTAANYRNGGEPNPWEDRLAAAVVEGERVLAATGTSGVRDTIYDLARETLASHDEYATRGWVMEPIPNEAGVRAALATHEPEDRHD